MLLAAVAAIHPSALGGQPLPGLTEWLDRITAVDGCPRALLPQGGSSVHTLSQGQSAWILASMPSQPGVVVWGANVGVQGPRSHSVSLETGYSMQTRPGPLGTSVRVVFPADIEYGRDTPRIVQDFTPQTDLPPVAIHLLRFTAFATEWAESRPLHALDDVLVPGEPLSVWMDGEPSSWESARLAPPPRLLRVAVLLPDLSGLPSLAAIEYSFDGFSEIEGRVVYGGSFAERYAFILRSRATRTAHAPMPMPSLP